MVLHYEDLPITIYGEYVDDNYYEEPHYREKEERIVDFDYEVNDSEIIDILTGMIDYDEVPESISDDKIRDYIAKNLKNIYSNHEEEMLNYLEDEAIEAAERYYNEQESWGDYDESLKEGKMKLTERKWNYTIESETANKFRNSIDDGDLQGVKDSIIDIYEEIFNKGYIDEDDYNEYTEEVINVDLDEDEIDYQISLLYDLCDNLGVFIPTHINEEVKIGDSEYLRGIAFLNENPKAYAYICSAEINGKKVPVGKGIMTSDEYQEYIEKLNKNTKLGRVNTIYQNDKEGHLKALYSTLDEETESKINTNNTSNKLKIKIEVIINNSIGEDIVSGKIEDKYDDQTLEEWYDFAANIEGIIDRKFIVKNINLSKNVESLSEYIDFYQKDEKGNKIEGMIDLRLSDHKSTSNARRIRKKKANNLDPNNTLISIIVNGRLFDSYNSALKYIEELLNKLNESLNEDTVEQGNSWVNKGKEGTHGKFRTKKEADAQRKAMFANGYKEELKEDLDDLPFPEVEEERDIDLFKVEKLEYDLRDLMNTLHNEVINKNIPSKVYFDSLKEVYDKLDNISIPGVKEDLEIKSSEEKFNEKENDFSERDDDFDLDVDKLAEAVKNFEPQSPIMNESVTQSNQIVEEAKKENTNTNEISTKTDPNMDYDDVDDIELV